MSKAAQRRTRATGIRPTTQAEREMTRNIARQKARVAEQTFEQLCKEIAAAMPTSKREHRAQVKTLRHAMYPMLRARFDADIARSAAFEDRMFGGIRCEELFDLVCFANDRAYRIPKSDAAHAHEIALLLQYAGLQVDLTIAMLEKFVGDEVDQRQVPLVRHEDLRWLPYWQLDLPAEEWVQKQPDGTEIQRRPLRPAEATGQEDSG